LDYSVIIHHYFLPRYSSKDKNDFLQKGV
jgi:hypothetical protein